MITPIDPIQIATNAIVINTALQVQKETTIDLLNDTIQYMDPIEKKGFILDVMV